MFGRWPKVTWLRKVIRPETIVKKPSAILAFGSIMHPEQKVPGILLKIEVERKKRKKIPRTISRNVYLLFSRICNLSE